jgi:hypothetical protein
MSFSKRQLESQMVYGEESEAGGASVSQELALDDRDDDAGSNSD